MHKVVTGYQVNSYPHLSPAAAKSQSNWSLQPAPFIPMGIGTIQTEKGKPSPDLPDSRSHHIAGTSTQQICL